MRLKHFTEIKLRGHRIAPIAGYTPGTQFTLSHIISSGETNAEVMVLGWTGTYGDWNSAVEANTANPGSVLLGWTGSSLSGGALTWDNVVSVPPEPPFLLNHGSLGFNGLVLEVVPEPSMFALAGLCAAVLVILPHRR